MNGPNPPIAVVICSRDPDALSFVERNLRRTAGGEFQFVPIDNRNGRYGICEAYNEGLRRSEAPIVVFQHEDVFHTGEGWAQWLINRFALRPEMALLGVAGTSLLLAGKPAWTAARRPFLAGRVVHELDGGRRYFLTEFSAPGPDREVVAVDGLWFAVRREAALATGFDAQNFPGFHFYDLDFCLRLRKAGKLFVTTDLLLKHFSGGNAGESWKVAAAQYLSVHGMSLPAYVEGIDPTLLPTGNFEVQDLRGKVPQVTLI